MYYLNQYKQYGLKIKKNQALVFILTLLLFLPNNLGSFPVVGPFIVSLNNVAAAYIILGYLYAVIKSKKLRMNVSCICKACIVFYIVRIGLVYLHNGAFGLNEWITTIKRLASIIWLEKEILKSRKNYNAIMYAFWLWVFVDCVVTIIWPGGSELFAGGYLLGWKNNKIEFLFTANLLALIEIEKYELTIKNAFFKRWIVFSLLCIINSILADSGTTTLLMVFVCIYPFAKSILGKGKIISAEGIAIIHLFVWYLVVINNQGKYSIIGQINELLFHRDATFTGRTFLWAQALLLISQSFFTGYVDNFMGYGNFTILSGSLSGYIWEMAHNQVLELFMQGGLVLFSVFAYIIIAILYQNRICSKKTLLARWMIFALLFTYLTEAFLNPITFVNLILIYYASQWIQEGLKENIDVKI